MNKKREITPENVPIVNGEGCAVCLLGLINHLKKILSIIFICHTEINFYTASVCK